MVNINFFIHLPANYVKICIFKKCYIYVGKTKPHLDFLFQNVFFSSQKYSQMP